MPKVSNKIDYAITPVSFYRFVCKDAEVKSSYVGSTTNFTQRKYQHKHGCNNTTSKHHNFKIYQIIRANGGWKNWTMIEIVNKLCQSRRDAERQEQEIMDELHTDMNTQKPFSTHEATKERKAKYLADNADGIKTYQAKYKADNADKIKAYKVKYRQDNADKISATQAKYREENADEIRTYQAKYYADRCSKTMRAGE